MRITNNPTSVSINDECLTAFNEFRMSHGKTRFIIFKISDNKKEIVLDDVSSEQDYEAFRTKLSSAQDDKGKPAPRYAVYDVEYEIPGEGKRCVSCLSFFLSGCMVWYGRVDG